jgi:nucleoside phosphorylase
MTDGAIIVCPLQFERDALRRTSLTSHFDLQCCGIGARAIDRWVRDLPPVDRPVILAGLAGGLNNRFPAGSAWWITNVVRDDQSADWSPPVIGFGVSGAAPTRCIITSAMDSVTNVARKRWLRDQSGADLVDLESAAFAQAASERGLRWGIVRGVSDDASTSLPSNIDQWVDSRGKPRLFIILRSIIAQPALLPAMLRLRRRANAATTALAHLLKTSPNLQSDQ